MNQYSVYMDQLLSLAHTRGLTTVVVLCVCVCACVCLSHTVLAVHIPQYHRYTRKVRMYGYSFGTIHTETFFMNQYSHGSYVQTSNIEDSTMQ